MPLQEQLEAITLKLKALVPAERLAVIEQAIQQLNASNAAGRALKIGDAAPQFELPDGDGRVWRSKDFLQAGPLVIVFYRGRWCAYCNAQLVALQEIYKQLTAAGASLVAISPQTQKHSYMTRDMHKLRYPVLSDSGNQVAGKFGLVYRLSSELQAMYESIYMRLPGYNGDPGWELPLAATYIVQPDGTIGYARVDADWRQRSDPEEILKEFPGPQPPQ